MDKEYLKSIIARITGKKEESKVSPSSALMSEVMESVREDALETMRQMCNDGEIAVSKTLNSVSFKCL